MSLLLICILTLSSSALAHSGRTDANGGHYNRKTGEYHYHNPPGSSTTPSDPTTEPPVVSEPVAKPTVPASEIINVKLDGNYLTMDTPPLVEKGRTLVPLRAIFEALGATVDYNSSTKTITATKDNTVIVLQIGKIACQVNNKTHNLDVPAKIVAGRTMVPIRFVSEALGAKVEWDGTTKTVYITSVTANVSNPNSNLPSSTSDTVVYAIDVGQADSLLIVSGSSAMLIDGGNNSDGDDVVKFVKDHGVKELDVVIATHPHEDHIGGLDDVIHSFPVKKVIESKETSTSTTYKDFSNAIKSKNVPVEYPNNQKFSIGSSQVEILGPIKDYEDVNDDSVVARVSVGNVSFLFTGDMEGVAEQDLLNKLGPTTVLKVGHHGSTTSTSQEMLDKVKPQIAVISVGTNNKYHHPAPTTVNRLKEFGAQVYETDINGMVYIWTNGKDYKVVAEKAS